MRTFKTLRESLDNFSAYSTVAPLPTIGTKPIQPNAFCLLKPGFVDDYEDDFCNILGEYGWNILDKKRVRLTPDDASKLYINMSDKPFYGDLCDYMSSGDCICCSCYKNSSDPIKEMECLKEIVRDMWGEDDMRNAMHSSDSPENVARECKLCMDCACNDTSNNTQSNVPTTYTPVTYNTQICDGEKSCYNESDNNTYNEIIESLRTAQRGGVPVQEGLFKALVGGVAGMTIAPSIMKTLCGILGIDTKGQFGSLLTSRLILTALCAKMGWDK